jgi:hypothetical protein
MVWAKKILASSVGACLIVVLFLFTWARLPKEGPFSEISFLLMPVVGVIVVWIVVSPGEVAMSFFED